MPGSQTGTWVSQATNSQATLCLKLSFPRDYHLWVISMYIDILTSWEWYVWLEIWINPFRMSFHWPIMGPLKFLKFLGGRNGKFPKKISSLGWKVSEICFRPLKSSNFLPNAYFDKYMIMYFIETINVYTIVESGRIRSVTVIRLSGTGRTPARCSEANFLSAAKFIW